MDYLCSGKVSHSTRGAGRKREKNHSKLLHETSVLFAACLQRVLLFMLSRTLIETSIKLLQVSEGWRCERIYLPNELVFLANVHGSTHDFS